MFKIKCKLYSIFIYTNILLGNLVFAGTNLPFKDYLTQPAVLKSPARGTITGELSAFNLSENSLVNGGFSFALPIEFPQQRGALLTNIIPIYSTTHGQSEWGMGFNLQLSIFRYRELGQIDYKNDSLMSPWGLLTRGTDNYFYPTGIEQNVRVDMVEPQKIVAYTTDGLKMTFGVSAYTQNIKMGIYAWYLTEIENLKKQKTQLTYVSNQTGVSYLSEVLYGGRSNNYQYKITFEYEKVKAPYFNYQSGQRRNFDNRASTITIFSKSKTDSFQKIYQYELSYKLDINSPQFFLNSIKKIFQSGESQPAMTFSYGDSAFHLNNAKWKHLDYFDHILEKTNLLFHPEYSAVLDLDNNGQIEFENRNDLSLVKVQTGAFELRANEIDYTRTSANQYEESFCKPQVGTLVTPRNHYQLMGLKSDPEIVYLKPKQQTTRIYICSRSGELKSVLDTSGYWDFEQHTRLVDLTNDGKPDLVRFYGAGFAISINESSLDSGYKFAEPVYINLGLKINPQGFWVQDYNGDGIPDLIARNHSGLFVWFGLGNANFDLNSQFLHFWDSRGKYLTDITNRSLSFVDINHDGFLDLILSNEFNSEVFINHGDHFLGISIPSVEEMLGYTYAIPGVIDLDGSGNSQIWILHKTKAYSIQLDEASTGLLSQIDDGKGNVLKIEYRRTEPSENIGNRFPVISKITKSVYGEGTSINEYSFSTPKIKDINNKFEGFQSVKISNQLIDTLLSFKIGSNFSVKLLSKVEIDHKMPNLIRFQNNEYQSYTTNGVSWQRLIRTEQGFKNDNNLKVSETMDIKSYVDDKCPSQVEIRNQHGLLYYQIDYTQLRDFEKFPICILSGFRELGKHENEEFNFSHSTLISRNEIGLPVEVSSISDQIRILQKIAYDDYFNIASIESPNTGTTYYSYYQNQLLATVTGPDGVKKYVHYDEANDQITSLDDKRGSLSLRQAYEYDGLSFLSKSWSVFPEIDALIDANSTNVNSVNEYKYKYASSSAFGQIIETNYVNEESNLIRRQRSDLLTGGGNSIGKIIKFGDSGILTDLVWIDREQKTQSKLNSKIISNFSTASNLNSADIYSEIANLNHLVKSGFEFNTSETTLYEKNVSGSKKLNVQIESGFLREVLNINNKIQWETDYNVSEGKLGRVITRKLPSGEKYKFSYDALKRLKEVELPSGDRHKIKYNNFGDIIKISRAQVGDINYFYNPLNGQVQRKDYLNTVGHLVRSIKYDYDQIGRMTDTIYTAGLYSIPFKFKYDETVLDGRSVEGQLGRNTSVIGPEFEKSYIYRQDGKIRTEMIDIFAFGKLKKHYFYRSDGSLKKQKIEQFDKPGNLINTLVLDYKLDTFGREILINYNGKSIVELNYDELSRIKNINLGSSKITFNFDEITQRLNGKQFNNISSDWSFNDRGLIEQENYLSDTKSEKNSYQYNENGFLEAFNTNQESYHYGYGIDSILYLFGSNSNNSNKIVSNLNSTERNWQFKNLTYKLDDLGRVQEKSSSGQKLVFGYGPQGRITQVLNGPMLPIDYTYDENGVRLIKRKGGKIDEVYLGDILLTSEKIFLKASISNQILGFLDSKEFHPLNTDQRNSVISSLSNSELNLPEPYGERKNRYPKKAQSVLIDYAMVGYDNDTGLYRMEQRDYDPEIKRFLTPDPLFFEDPEKCVVSPIECNLYGYAKNNPVSFVDPDGKESYLVSRDLWWNGNSFSHNFIYVKNDNIDKVISFGPDQNVSRYESLNLAITELKIFGNIKNVEGSSINKTDINSLLLVDTKFTKINAADDVVLNSAKLVSKYFEQNQIRYGLYMVGVNSNSAAQAVANLSVEGEVNTPKSSLFGAPSSDKYERITSPILFKEPKCLIPQTQKWPN